jgi:glycosyltransferase involved in cell wall biosynthesis
MDEVELIGPCLDHLNRIGVFDIIVHDMGSTDGTRDILRSREGAHLRVIDASNADDAEIWHQQVVTAVRALDADRVVMIDADEFILPRGGDLPAALARIDAEVVRFPRYNIVLGPRGLSSPLPIDPDNYGEIELFVRAEPDFRKKLEQDPTQFWLRAVPVPKIAVPPGAVERFKDGMHGIVARPGMQLRNCLADNVLIAHAALTTYPRFSRKIRNVREVFRLHDGALPPEFGWHWRRWVQLDDDGGLRAEFDRSHLSADALARLRAEGIVRSAADVLQTAA